VISPAGDVMAIENRYRKCRVCGGLVYRYPYPGGTYPDRWVHTLPGDWMGNPHTPDPEPEDTEDADA
jgi:hypothetical protein